MLDRNAARSPAARPSASAWPRRSARKTDGRLYVLDEPSIGLHQRDNRKLIESLLELRDLGNTVIVVEHDEETIEHARPRHRPRPASRRARRQIVARGRSSRSRLPASLTRQ